MDWAGAHLAETFDALWIEDIGGLRSQAVLGPPCGATGARDYALALGAGHLRARVVPDGWRDGVRLSGPVRYETAARGESLDAAGLLARLLAGLSDLPEGVAQRTIAEAEAIRDRADLWTDTAETLQQEVLAGSALAFERLAAWRDRPFHPLGRARHGFDDGDAVAYGAEHGRLFPLDWWAVAREGCAAAPGADPDGPASTLLDAAQRGQLDAELVRRSLSGTHVALPVHPWQAEHSLPMAFGPEIAEGRLVPLGFRGPLAAATSSLRTLAFPARPDLHLKLPLDVQTLGVRRTLPPQSLHNGLHGAALLAAARARDPWFARHVVLADEAAFWHVTEPGGDLFAARPALLGCAIRRLPTDGAVPVPLASFAVAPLGSLPPAVSALGLGAGDLPRLFAGLADLVLGTALGGACLGFVPELHGQNALVLLEKGEPARLLLRDHDTVRCAPAWLAEAGLPVPAYHLADPVRNTLLLRQPEDLLAYVQTLAIDVALRAVAETFAAAGTGFTLGAARATLAATVERVLARAALPAPRKDVIAARMLGRETAPFKAVLAPLLATVRIGTSMPSRVVAAPNPLWRGEPTL
ncbi:IucA/IucC family protein [Methylobacterium gossipiicola]|uniref:Siderophore synthetase component n=1 Tax=Methylobacterium gossipiicola TaxID=582675 RepID=A0A1I2VJ70_9HYPH|nr:IucA/IucC family protein [Methylobacterium gossipiicola]SFG89328.1 Siderophore synthetase component [Methylobacterium gossipiicola]